MRLTDLHAQLLTMDQDVFSTADAVRHLGLRPAHASKSLSRLAGAGHLLRLQRGLWALAGRADPMQIAPWLTAPFPAYVSLQSALYMHGIISQIPEVIYLVSLSRTRRHTTPLGTFSMHHIQPSFFFGFTVLHKAKIRIALPEKALLDFFYLSPARSYLFRDLPEVDFPESFSDAKTWQMIGRIQSIRRRTLVARRYRALREQARE